MTTPWTADVDPTAPWPEHPRPQFQREGWTSLNGQWDYAILTGSGLSDGAAADHFPQHWQGKIVVPYPVESMLSGVTKRVSPQQRLWYRRSVKLPPVENEDRLLLHFDAVDWATQVWLDGEKLGTHFGGYDPFSIEIPATARDDGAHELIVEVWDPTDNHFQPRGKQVQNPHGIWYTPTTGIWQSVWLERVGASYLHDLKLNGSYLAGTLEIDVAIDGPEDGLRLQYTITPMAEMLEPEHGLFLQADGPPQKGSMGLRNGRFRDLAQIEAPAPWTPEQPNLYVLELVLVRNGWPIDRVQSYFGLRDLHRRKDAAGKPRLYFNGEFLFQLGMLDQGFWPDGLYTAANDAALRKDLLVTKELGFNMLRKHVKVEPSRWYAWCDRLGILVWQDMPSGDGYIGPKDADFVRSKESAANFESEFGGVINALRNHPSIVAWVPFNEGWGQFDTARISQWTRQQDPTRWVNAVSGWADRPVGDMLDIHSYPGPALPKLDAKRAAVLGEFGGLGLPVEGHTWQDKENWGYRSYANAEALTSAYERLMVALRPMIGEGLNAAIYTQVSDVEIEVNGVMTYDRKVLKMDAERVRRANQKLYLPPPQIHMVLPDSRQQAQGWKYYLSAPLEAESKPATPWNPPPEDWWKPEFDDSNWQVGDAGFGTPETPGAVVRTQWNNQQIWIRRAFGWAGPPLGGLHLRIHHDEDCQVYLNGTKIADLKGYTTGYVLVPIAPEHEKLLNTTLNVIAATCTQTGGGQYLDLGLVYVEEAQN